MRKIILPLAVLVLVVGVSTTRATPPADGQLLPADQPIAKVIDHYIDAKLKTTEEKVSPLVNDAGYIRRVTIDLVGRIPTVTELDAYVANSDPQKKEKLVDRLMKSPEYAVHQADRFNAFLNYEKNRNDNLKNYLQTCFENNRPWDEMFREMLLPDQTDAKKKGATDFLRSRVRDLNVVTVDVSTRFFGVNISCAQCHDHPHVPSWTQDHFYGMKTFFVRTFDNGGFLAERSYGKIEYTPNKGKQKTAPVMFLSGKTINPPGLDDPDKKAKKKEQDLFNKFKKQKKPAPNPEYSLREKFVQISLEKGGQEFFSRSIANRIWHQYIGYGIVMPLDQMHEENFPSHPKLLTWLARDMVTHGYDMKRLVRGIVLSDTYARSSKFAGELPPPANLFAVAQVRALPPLSLSKSLYLAGSDPDYWNVKGDELKKRLDGINGRARGLANLFPEPGENFQVSVDEAMFFSNNDRITRDLLQPGNTLVGRMMKIEDPKARAELAVKTVLSRPAKDTELSAIVNYMREREEQKQQACQQVVWALLTSSEFRFNH